MKKLLFISVFVFVIVTNTSSQTSTTTNFDITWTKMPPNPDYGSSGYMSMFYTPITGQIYVRGVMPGSNLIYTSEDYFYNVSNNTFTHAGGTGAMNPPSCYNDITGSQPPERHTYRQAALDTKRNWIWMTEGANEGCNTFNPARNLSDLYHYNLAANPINSSWHKITPNTIPTTSAISSFIVYDPDNDVLVRWGNSADSPMLVYCPTESNPTPGTLTASQTAAGCIVPDDWNSFQSWNGSADVNGTSVTYVSGDAFTILSPDDYIWIYDSFYQIASITDASHLVLKSAPSGGNHVNYNWRTVPPGTAESTAFYDTQTQAIYTFGGASQSSTYYYNQVWKYTVQSKKWNRVALNTLLPAIEPNMPIGQIAVAYNTLDHCIYYHRIDAPNTPEDWKYSPLLDTWTKLSSVGVGSTDPYGALIAFDPITNSLVTFSGGGTGGVSNIWRGQLASTTNISSSIPVQNYKIDVAYDNNRTNLFFVNMPMEKDVYLYDITGKLIMTRGKCTSSSISFEKSLYTNGLYMVYVKADNTFLSKKIIIQ